MHTISKISIVTCATLMFSASPLMSHQSDENTPSVAQELSELKRQTAENNKKIRRLETRLNNGAPQTSLEATEQNWPPHYMGIPNTNSAIQFIINPNLAVAYDIGSYTTDLVFPPFLPLKRVNPDLKTNRLNAQARATQLGFRTLSHTNIGDVKTEVSLDFWGDTYNVIPSTPFYQPRVRFAYVEAAGFTVGQTTSNFVDLDAIGETVDYGTALGMSYRHGLIQYAFHLNKKTSLRIAAERPATDYTDNLGRSINYTAPVLSASTPSLPDATAHLKYQDTFGHVALRGMIRQLKVKDYSLAVPFAAKKTGWGLGISGKFFVYNKSNLFGQFNFGDGIGRYIVLLNGQSSLYNSTLRVLDPQKATNTIVGFEHFWNELFRSNIIYAHIQVRVSKFTPILTGTTRVTKSMNQFYLNLIYSPIKPLDVGIEYEYADRKSTDNYRGKANRITLGVTYKF